MRSSRTPQFCVSGACCLGRVLFAAPTCDPITDSRKGKIWRVRYQGRE
jgi:hypothetical protein